MGDPRLPGVERVDEALQHRLEAAARAQETGDRPRTRHLKADGSPRFVNRLILEQSPYLLQHAHNPVNWFPWGSEAFERARREGKPIFLSVGYATCHWCHVMERESFEDEEIAAFLNAHFIPIKVDREERPDVDETYMQAVYLFSGHGGWPMTVVATPEGEPFFAATYLPPRDGARGARRGLLSILKELSRAYAEERERVLGHAQALTERLRRLARPRPPVSVPTAEVLERGAAQMLASYDPRIGAFGRAPLFPQPSRLRFLLHYHRRTGSRRALSAVTGTLRAMADGGLHDQLGGGFHRYSTDAKWLVPHFEKMLYDNAQLALAYLEGWQASGDPYLLQVARRTLDYMEHDLALSEGGFASATDADSVPPDGGEPEEGRYFTWTPEEIQRVLGATLASLAVRRWGVVPEGHLEGRSVLHVAVSLEELSRETGRSIEALQKELGGIREKLLAARAHRPPPLRDDKVVLGWNALAVSAFARAAAALDAPNYLERARRTARFLLSSLRDEHGRLFRVWRRGRARHAATLTDHALLVAALLDLFEADADPFWLREALRVQRQQQERFADEAHGGYFLTPADGERLLVRDKPEHDGALPSGNSVAARNLLRLAALTMDGRWRQLAETTVAAFGEVLSRRPAAMPQMLRAVDWLDEGGAEVALVSPPGDVAACKSLRASIGRRFEPNQVVVVLSADRLESLSSLVPWLRAKEAIDGRPTAYVCEEGRCELPVHTPEGLARRLDARRVPLARP